MRIRELRLQQIQIPFKTTFRHASAERARTSSVWAEAVGSDGLTGYGESCPRPYVTEETIDSVRAFVVRHEASICADVADLESIRIWMAGHADEVNRNPAAWCALEIAILDLLAKEQSQPLEALLSLPPLTGCFSYTAVVGDAEPDVFARMVEQYRRHGFTDFKIKLAGDLERDRAKLEALRDGPAARIRADANNLWERAETAVRFLRDLDGRFFAVEEPIQANQYDDLASISEALECRIVLDESFLRVDQMARLPASASRWLVNVRVSKMGGLLRSLEVVERLRAEGVGMIVGAQVGETSVLTRAALTVAHAGRDILVAQEGAFGTLLLSADICDPPLMFGAGGVLDASRYSSLREAGLGIVEPPPDRQILSPLHP